jgi:trans-AT polyketide synthase, acyltransferase and oxidoreductase domains
MEFRAQQLGSRIFREDHKLDYAYIAGSMYKGIASAEMVVRMGKAGMLGYLGTGGMSREDIEENILKIKTQLNKGQSFGMNLLCNMLHPDAERETVELFLKHGVERIEASAFTQLTPWIVLYRAKGLYRNTQGSVSTRHWILAKISRPEVAEQFLKPCPEKLLLELRNKNYLTDEEADLAKHYPVADDICVESDSGGHTDQGIALVLLPSIIRLRDRIHEQFQYEKKIRIGAAGGLGTPEALAAVFILGADFVLTGSINQCTVEAGTSELVKDMLAQVQVQDTTMAPAGDMLEVGAKVRVLSKGVLFPSRAQKLYDLYRQYPSWEAIEEKPRRQIEERFLKKSFNAVWEEIETRYENRDPELLERARKNAKSKLALVFRSYFGRSTRAAQEGIVEDKVDFQIQCGPALGAFNSWVKGSELENWQNRHVDEIGQRLMDETAAYLSLRLVSLSNS